MLNSTLCYLERGDEYLMLHRVKKAHDLNRDKWLRMAITNTACSGVFSSDRTIAEYNDKIWHLHALRKQ